ncbi:MAG: ATP-binding protein [Pseudomonadota bacterium]
MRLPSLLRTTAFRLALLYTVLFGGFAALLLGFLYWTTTSYMERQTEQSISAEAASLQDEYRLHGLDGLRHIIEQRSAAAEDTDRFYLLAREDLTPLAGNLSDWPRDADEEDGWLDFSTTESETNEHDDGHDPLPARALQIALPDGQRLLVGRNLHEREDLREHLLTALTWALFIALLLALTGGLMMSRGVLRRIDAINRTSRSIMAGHLERRVPISGSGDEFDQLAENLNRMLERIQQLMDGMRQVSDNVAHDLRSPLSRLRSRLEVALLTPRSETEYRAALEQTLDDADEILKTFNALLSIAQAEAGASADWEALSLSAVARDVAELYQPVAEERGQTFTVRVEEGLHLRGNRHLLIQALSKLLDNAIKYTPAGGAVQLSAARVRDAIEVTVADNGPGIPPAARDKVLERFVRLEASRSTPGSGLGLSLVRAVAYLHRAQLRLEDNQPGLRVVLRFAAGI